MFQAFSRLFVLIASASIVVGNGTQIIDWHALNDAEPNQDDTQIRLILYNRKWREGTTDMSHLKKKLHTFVLIHGFNDNLKDSIMLPLLSKNYLDREKCNVVVVDWAEFAKGPWFINAAKNTLIVGKQLAAWLDTSGLDMRRVTLVGFSMGAHVAGDAGHFARKRVSRIVALDPAHFLFQNSPPEFRLDSTDADIVEVVHTSGGYVGEKESLGTRDFFPNGGSYPQPGCSPDPTGTCSHRRAYYYYGEAISRPDDNFRGRRCNSYEHFVKHKCREKGKPVILHLVNTNRDKLFTGNFYFMTNSKEPFLRRNVSDNASSTTEKHPTTTGKRLTTEIQQVTVDKHRATKDKQQFVPTTTIKGFATMNKIQPTTGKRHASPTDSSKDSSTPTSKHRTTMGKHQPTASIRQTVPDIHQATTDKHRMSTDKNRMTMDKYQATPDKYWTTTGKHHKITEKQYATLMGSIKNSSTTTSKYRMTAGMHQTTTDKRHTSTNKHQTFANRHPTTLDKQYADTMSSSKYSSAATSKHRTTVDKRATAEKHQTTMDKHRSTPMGSSKYSSTATSKHRMTADKQRTNMGIDYTTTGKYGTTADKRWTIVDLHQTTIDKHLTSTQTRRMTTEKRLATTDKHQTLMEKHHPTPMGSSKYSSTATSKHRTSADKHRTTMGIDHAPRDKHGSTADKRWTIMGIHQAAVDKFQTSTDKQRMTTVIQDEPTTLRRNGPDLAFDDE